MQLDSGPFQRAARRVYHQAGSTSEYRLRFTFPSVAFDLEMHSAQARDPATVLSLPAIGGTCAATPGLKTFPVWWKIDLVHAVKVDDAQRIRIPALRPGDDYEPELLGENDVLLRKVELPRRKPTFAQALAAVESSPLRFTKGWDEIKKESRRSSLTAAKKRSNYTITRPNRRDLFPTGQIYGLTPLTNEKCQSG